MSTSTSIPSSTATIQPGSQAQDARRKNYAPCSACREAHRKCNGGYPCVGCNKNETKALECVPSKRSHHRHLPVEGEMLVRAVEGFDSKELQFIIENPAQGQTQLRSESESGSGAKQPTNKKLNSKDLIDIAPPGNASKAIQGFPLIEEKQISASEIENNAVMGDIYPPNHVRSVIDTPDPMMASTAAPSFTRVHDYRVASQFGHYPQTCTMDQTNEMFNDEAMGMWLPYIQLEQYFQAAGFPSD